MMASDNGTTMGELKAKVEAFVAARQWERFHTGKNLAMSIAIEAAELMEHFQWSPEADSPLKKAEAAEELADVLIYALALSNRLDIDVAAAITAKLHKNETRFPIADDGRYPFTKEQ
jgi:NTP pyrophosphatase (non-canonical NTP hydrolase)